MENTEDNKMNQGARPKEYSHEQEGSPDESSEGGESDAVHQAALQSQERPRQDQDPLVAGAGRGFGRGLPLEPSEIVLPRARGRPGGSDGRGATVRTQ